MTQHAVNITMMKTFIFFILFFKWKTPFQDKFLYKTVSFSFFGLQTLALIREGVRVGPDLDRVELWSP